MSRIRRAVATVVVAVVASLFVTVPAHAMVSELTCGPLSNSVYTYAPPLTNTPQTVAITISRWYQSCASITHPAITSGTSTSSAGIAMSCNDLLNTGTFTFEVKWDSDSDSDLTSVFTGNFTSSHIGGTLTATSTGTVTAGVFAGSGFVQVNAMPLTDSNLIACSLGLGTVSSTSGPLTLTIF